MPGEALPATPGDVQAAQIETLLASSGRSDAATRAAIESALGAADVARQDGAGAALTYRLDGCALLLLFASDANNSMRLRDVHVSARRAGAPTPSLAQCAAEAAARQS